MLAGVEADLTKGQETLVEEAEQEQAEQTTLLVETLPQTLVQVEEVAET
jgi:hypothetical protein